ncbi:MAG: S8 family serine peptidase [Chloroflexota bacterium]
MIRKLLILVILVVVALVVAGRFSPSATAATWQQKVDPWVLETAAGGPTEFIVFLTGQADLSGAAGLRTKLAKGTYVYQQLTEVANRTQGPVLAALAAEGVAHRPYWVANMIWVRGDLAIVQAMAQRNDVAHLYANPWVKLPEPALQGNGEHGPETIEWNIDLVGAPDLWAMGYTGQGAVIAGQDTGYDWDHPALINHYRGWDGSADHNYNWHDSIHDNNPNTPPGNPCGFDVQEPCDDNSHGTHTMGTMVGDDGGTNQIGMAPGAEWIGCRNMEEGWGTPTTYSECFEWFIAPTDLNGENPDPSKAPHVISNSWSCPTAEGCVDPNIMLTVVNNVRAAGIAIVVSAGNSGSSCSTVSTPAAIYEASFTVGATDSSDNIAGFSSRGPVTVDGSNRLKPNISAPGVNIRSSVPGGGYAGGWSGTSMAAPHVAGLVGLLISAEPSLAGQVDTLEDAIEQSAVARTSTQTCGGVPGSEIPNNTFGWGRIDALAAYEALQHHLTVEKSGPTYVEPGDQLTYTLIVSHTHLFTQTTNVVLTDTIPADTTFVSATEPYTLNGDMVQWDLAALAANSAWSVDLVVQVDAGASGMIVNDDYAVRSDDVSTVQGSAVQTPVVTHGLSLSKSASAASIQVGEMLTYTLVVTNLHPFEAATNVTLSDTLPAGTMFMEATGGGTFDGTTVQWETASLAANGVWTVQLIVHVMEDPGGGMITNSDYSVASDEAPTQVAGDPVSTAVLSPPDEDYYIYLPVIRYDP